MHYFLTITQQLLNVQKLMLNHKKIIDYLNLIIALVYLYQTLTLWYHLSAQRSHLHYFLKASWLYQYDRYGKLVINFFFLRLLLFYQKKKKLPIIKGVFVHSFAIFNMWYAYWLWIWDRRKKLFNQFKVLKANNNKKKFTWNYKRRKFE